MALGTTYIEKEALKTYLGESTDDVLALCTSANINRFSKYKPIRDAGLGVNWPAGSDNHYGLDLANNWAYLQPRGSKSPDEPGRPLDFRGYEHSESLTLPPIYTEDTGPTILHPSGTPYSYNFSPIPVYDSASDVRIRTSDLGIDGWYLGIKLVGLPGGPWYKTGTQLNSTGGKAISFSTEMTDPSTPAYSNCPYGIGNDIEWYLIISDTQKSTWSASAPTTYYYLPTGSYGGLTMVTSGTFDITDWVAITQSGSIDYTMLFTAAGGSQDATVKCSYAGGPPDWTVYDNASWITTDTISAEGGIHISDSLVVDGNAVRVTASPINDYSDVVCEHDTSDGYTWTMGSESGSVNPDLVRANGAVIITSNGQSKNIVVSQGSTGDDQISFSYRPLEDGSDFPPSGATINYQIFNGAIQVYPSSGWASATGQGAHTTNNIGPLTMTETAQNDTYTVKIKLM